MINAIGVFVILGVELTILCLRINDFLKTILVNVCLYILGMWDIIGYCFLDAHMMILVMGIFCSSIAFVNILTSLYYTKRN